MNVCAIIVAAGKGTRMGLNQNKVYLELKARPVLLYSLERFQNSGLIQSIILVVAEGERAQAAELVEKYHISKVRQIVNGGTTRYGSVKNALAVVEQTVDLVAVHDGARPLLTEEDLHNVIEAATAADGAVLAYPLHDSIKQVNGNIIKKSLERKDLWGMMTPQVFAFQTLFQAYASGNEAATDDAQLVEAAGGKVVVVQGKRENLKITTPLDMHLAEFILDFQNNNAKNDSGKK